MLFSPQELDRWQQAIGQPPRTLRVPLVLGPQQVGSLEPQTWERLLPALAQSGYAAERIIQKTEQYCYIEYAMKPDFNENFARVAAALAQAGVAGVWRNECLPVRAPDGTLCAHVERGVVRVLGIATQAVHLVGWRSDGCLWLQQRAHNKANDPGLWDTLMGGTVAGDETLQQTLVRETWEEAGLHLADLHDVRWGGRFTATRHVPDGGGAGYMVEDTHWYTARVPDACVPCNQDGEVDHFEAWTPLQVVEAMRAGRFTLEACWVLSQVLMAQAEGG
ncbi:MAG TPA: NUDIX domain-containing protein [Burkholderiaceae bacterium]|nr:NUDIX domain-containing protein [Burkholderiaceae bacterium]